MLFVAIFTFSFFSSVLTSGLGNVDGSWLIWIIFAVASIVSLVMSFSRFDRLPGHKGLFGLIFNMVALVLGSLVVFLQPVSDLWYYGASFILIAAVLVTLVDVIRAFNILSTRKLPQFDTHKGGDDRAK